MHPRFIRALLLTMLVRSRTMHYPLDLIITGTLELPMMTDSVSTRTR
jgi:hypothetical protein